MQSTMVSFSVERAKEDKIGAGKNFGHRGQASSSKPGHPGLTVAQQNLASRLKLQKVDVSWENLLPIPSDQRYPNYCLPHSIGEVVTALVRRNKENQYVDLDWLCDRAKAKEEVMDEKRGTDMSLLYPVLLQEGVRLITENKDHVQIKNINYEEIEKKDPQFLKKVCMEIAKNGPVVGIVTYYDSLLESDLNEPYRAREGKTIPKFMKKKQQKREKQKNFVPQNMNGRQHAMVIYGYKITPEGSVIFYFQNNHGANYHTGGRGLLASEVLETVFAFRFGHLD